MDNQTNAPLWWQPFADTSKIARAQGYNVAKQPVAAWQVSDVFKPALGGCTNMNQLIGFLKWQLNIDGLDKNGLLAETQTAVFPTKINEYTSIGKAWHVIEQTKRLTVCAASGSTNGQAAFMAFVPQTKTGVVILANARIGQGRLGLLILKILNENWRRKP